jgi:hypothetical protein
MANSSIICKAKNKIVRELIKDKEIVDAINSSDVKSPEKLIGTHIFDYHQNPNTLNTVGTFITIQVHIPNSYYYGGRKIFVNPTIEIWIISHSNHMVVDNIGKITENRNDYLSRLIDNKFNGKPIVGFGDVELLSNEEGAYQMDYVYRKMLFECTDLNLSLCENE